MKTIDVSEAQGCLPELLCQIQGAGAEMIITQRDKRLAKLVAYEDAEVTEAPSKVARTIPDFRGLSRRLGLTSGLAENEILIMRAKG